jgi:phospholipase A1
MRTTKAPLKNLRLFLILSCLFLGFPGSAFAIGETSPQEAQKSMVFDAEMNEQSPVHLGYYRPLYFVTGTPDTKVQLSFKYQPVASTPFYLGYTQRMFWYLYRNSAPIYDTNYNPEFFYRVRLPDDHFFKTLDVGLFEHESNGRGGSASRSVDDSYLRFNGFTKMNGSTLEASVKLFALYLLDDPNADLRDYRGYWQGTVSLRDALPDFLMKNEVYFTSTQGQNYAGFDVLKGSQELGLRFKLGFPNLDTRLYFQFYRGYDDSMLHYNQFETGYRGGISL